MERGEKIGGKTGCATARPIIEKYLSEFFSITMAGEVDIDVYCVELDLRRRVVARVQQYFPDRSVHLGKVAEIATNSENYIKISI